MALQLSDIQIRDPFVLPHPESHEYLLFGSTDPNIWSGPATGFDCYRSSDLVHWEGPVPAFRPPPGSWSREQFWAPEVHLKELEDTVVLDPPAAVISNSRTTPGRRAQ